MRLDVDLEQPVERRLVGVSRRCEGGKAGTVDQNIDLACRVGDAPHLGHLREISGDEPCIVPTRQDLLHGARAAGLVAAGDDHRRAFSAIASAVAEPIPDVPPVIRAVLRWSDMYRVLL